MKTEKEAQKGSSQHEDGSNAIPVITTTVGAIAGGVVTSTPAITAGGATTGLTAYSIGLGGLIAKVGCGSAAVISSLTMVAAGPVLGGLLGYSAYKAVKDMRKKNKKNGSNGSNVKSEENDDTIANI